MEELEHFRNEISEMVELERGLLRETLERESASIRRQVLDAYANNKSEILSMLKVEIQKRLQNARDNVFVMTDALKRDMDNLKEDLGQAQVSTLEFSIITLTSIMVAGHYLIFFTSHKSCVWQSFLAARNSRAGLFMVHAGYTTL